MRSRFSNGVQVGAASPFVNLFQHLHDESSLVLCKVPLGATYTMRGEWENLRYLLIYREL